MTATTTTSTTKTTTRTKRIGLSILAFLIAALALFSPATAGEKQKKATPATALVAGTVFRDSGLSLPGARISLEATPEAGVKSKFKKTAMTADSRGEFAMRVPAVPMKYRLTAGADGFETATREVNVQGEERVDLSIVLAPKSK